MDRLVTITALFLRRLLIMLAIPIVSGNSNLRSKFSKYPEHQLKKMIYESNRREILYGKFQ